MPEFLSNVLIGDGTPPPTTALDLDIIQEGKSNAAQIWSAGSGFTSFITFFKANGLFTALTKVLNSDALGRLRARGYYASAWSNTQAEMRMVATEDWNDSSHLGTKFQFHGTPNASNVLTLFLDVDETGLVVRSTNINTGWFEIPDTWTYSAADVFTVPTGATTEYQKGDYLRWKQGGSYKYGTVLSVTSTSITIIANTDYTIANSAITNIAFSRGVNPFGWPGNFNVNPSCTGFSSQPTSTVYQYRTTGNTMTYDFRQGGNGTSNANTFTIPLPVTAKTISGMIWYGNSGVCVDNTGTLTTPILVQISSAGTAINLFKDMAATVWPTSGNKRANGSITFQF